MSTRLFLLILFCCGRPVWAEYFDVLRCVDHSPYMELISKLVIPDHLTLTVCFWINLRQRGVSTVCSLSSDLEFNLILIRVNQNEHTLLAKIGSDAVKFVLDLDTRSWTHLCVVWFGSMGDMHLYANGSLVDVQFPPVFGQTRKSVAGQRVTLVLGETVRESDGKFDLLQRVRGSVHQMKIFSVSLLDQYQDLYRCRGPAGDVFDHVNKKWKKHCVFDEPDSPCL